MGVFEKIDGAVDSLASIVAGPLRHAHAKVAIYILLAFIVIGIPYSLVRHVQTSGFYVVSVERERKVGRKAAKEMEKRMELLPKNDPKGLYVAEVGRRVAEQNNPWSADFSFGIIRDPSMINAFALPGGKIYVTTGMLHRLDNEAELAAVLAHEVAHVSQRHYARNMGRQMLMSWVKKFLGGTDRAILDAGSFLTTNVAFLRMRQEDEFEADYYGTLYIYELDYDPSAAVTLSEKLLKLEREMPDYVKVLAMTHPPSRERVEAMRKLKESLVEKEGLTLGEKRYRKKIGKVAPSVFLRR
jgi:predicted Zn-dependent protease